LKIFQSAVPVAQKDIRDDFYKERHPKPATRGPLPTSPAPSPRSRVEKERNTSGPTVTTKPALRFADVPPSLSAVKPGSVSTVPGLGRVPVTWNLPGSVPAPVGIPAPRPSRFTPGASLTEVNAARHSTTGAMPAAGSPAELPPLTGYTTHQFHNLLPLNYEGGSNGGTG
jgi:hypothetical protein